MKKGFTLVEMLAVILILGVILLVGVPIYQGIQSNTNNSISESKIANVKAKAEEYSSSHRELVYDIKYMIEQGLLTPDNEYGEYKDPSTGRDMRCDVIRVDIENGNYVASITPVTEIKYDAGCIPIDELRKMSSVVDIHLYKEENGEEEYTDKWINAENVYAGYNVPEHDEGTEVKAEWSGDGTILENGRFLVSAITIKNTTIFLDTTFAFNNMPYKQVASKDVFIDRESPTAIVTQSPGDEVTTNSKLVEWTLFDGEGSGVAGHLLVRQEDGVNPNSPCPNKESFGEIDDSIIVSKQLFNGTYYMCVIDNVGNIGFSKVDVKNIVTDGVQNLKVVIRSKNTNYNALDVNLDITFDNPNGSYQMCLSNTGYLECDKWIPYTKNVSWKFDGSLDGNNRNVYVSIKDEAGNTASNTNADYKVYKECSSTDDNITNSGTCSKKCDTGKRTETYDVLDKYTQKKCKTNQKREKTCNTQKCCDASHVTYKNGTTCTKACNGGTYNQLAVSTYDNSVRCSSFDKSSGGSSCNTQDCCSEVTYKNGTTCSKTCGGGTYNRMAYSAYDNNVRCSANDKTSGGSSCNPQSCCSKVTYRDGTTCSKPCGYGTYNQLAYSSYNGDRCTGSDISSGGASCKIKSCSSGSSGGSDHGSSGGSGGNSNGDRYIVGDKDCHGAGCWM